MNRNKQKRLSALRRILQEKSVPNQDAIKKHLLREGISVSQATLSRDLKGMGGFRKTMDGGRLAYTLPGPEDTIRVKESLGMAVREYMTDMVIVGNFMVIKTTPGNASSLCIILDNIAWKEIVGTIAGDDTILIIAQTDSDIKKVAERLGSLRF